MLKQYPEEKDELLEEIERHNLKRFVKQNRTNKDINLLDYNNYHAPWKNIQAMVDQIVKKGDKDIKALKFNYDILCSYKHSGSYTLLSRTFEVPPENDAMIVLGTTCMILLHQFTVVITGHLESILFRNQLKLKERFDLLTKSMQENIKSFPFSS